MIVDQTHAALDVAQSNLKVAKDQVLATAGQARAARFKLDHTIEDVNNQIALLRSNVAAVDTARAKLVLAQADYRRVVELQKTPGAVAKQNVNTKLAALRTAEAVLTQTIQQVYQIRASLGLPTLPADGRDLAEVPPNFDQTFCRCGLQCSKCCRPCAAGGRSDVVQRNAEGSDRRVLRPQQDGQRQ